MKSYLHIIFVASVVFLSSCSSENNSTVAEIVLSPEESALVCKATVAATMGRSIDIIEYNKSDEGISYVSYVRPDDGKVWKTRCKTKSNRVIWSTVDIDGPNTGNGRWRDHENDSVITFELSELEVSITEKFSDGSKSENSYSRASQ